MIDKLKVIVYPYALWTIIQVSLMNLGNGNTNHQAPALGWQSLLTALLLQPVMEFWFLYSMFLILVVFLVVHKVTQNTYLLMGISLAIFFAGLAFESQLPWALTKTTFHLPFFALGVLSSSWIRRDFAALGRAKLVVLAGGAFLLMTMGVMAGFRTENGSPQRFALALVGIAGALALSFLLDADAPAPLANVLRLWGEFSLPIFVLHVIVAAGLRIMLSRGLKFNDVTTHIFLGIIAGLYLPIFAARICRKIGFRYAFTFGK